MMHLIARLQRKSHQLFQFFWFLFLWRIARDVCTGGYNARYRRGLAGFDSRTGHTEDLKHATCDLPSIVLGNGSVQEKASRAGLPLACHQWRNWNGG